MQIDNLDFKQLILDVLSLNFFISDSERSINRLWFKWTN